MTHKRNHRQRDALRDFCARTGLTPREAGQALNGERTEVKPVDLLWVDAPELLALAEQAVNRKTIEMDSFTPDLLVEGEFEKISLGSFQARSVEVEDAYVDHADHPGVVGADLRIEGTGEVEWLVTNPTGGDAHAHGSRMEGIEDGPGIWVEREELVPVLVRIYAQYTTESASWKFIEVRWAGIEEGEARDRSARNDREETCRMQELGLLPNDDQI